MMDETEFSDDTPRRRKASRAPGRRPLAEGGSDDTRRTIRRQAIKLFNERGYASVSVDDIAQAAELTRATLYYHYRSKADIFVESVTDMFTYVHAKVMRVLLQRELSVKERLTLFVSGRREGQLPGYDTDIGEDLSEAMVIEAMQTLSPRHQATVGQSIASLHEATRALLAEGVENGELQPLPLSVLDYLYWQVFAPESYPYELEMSRIEWEAHLMSAFLHGITRS